ncbi:MAG TPA: hypothetical protein VGE41_01455 [Verrucomicrobiae bacterium]|jgi:hypothetical protein
MNHPTREELISMLYDENPPTTQARISAHLRSCTVCLEQLEAWRQTAEALDHAPALSTQSQRGFSWTSLAKYAAAALIVLGLGFLGGKYSTAEELGRMRAQISQLNEQSLASIKSENAEQLSRLAETLEAKIKSARLQNAAEYAGLHKELETVAVLTQASLQRAQDQIIQLAVDPKPAAGAKF